VSCQSGNSYIFSCEAELSFDEDSAIKALGITWHPRSDSFLFKVKLNGTAYAKFLNEIARTFDNLGGYAHSLLTPKYCFDNHGKNRIAGMISWMTRVRSDGLCISSSNFIVNHHFAFQDVL